jgi:hypothetical protein
MKIIGFALICWSVASVALAFSGRIVEAAIMLVALAIGIPFITWLTMG